MLKKPNNTCLHLYVKNRPKMIIVSIAMGQWPQKGTVQGQQEGTEGKDRILEVNVFEVHTYVCVYMKIMEPSKYCWKGRRMGLRGHNRVQCTWLKYIVSIYGNVTMKPVCTINVCYKKQSQRVRERRMGWSSEWGLWVLVCWAPLLRCVC
jgi:hypothetical protein